MINDVSVIYDSYCHETSDPDPDDEWDRASTCCDYDIKGISFDKGQIGRAHV